MTDLNTANTPIKTFDILKKLYEKDCTAEDLMSGFSDDTMRIYLNTLKDFGIKISSPTKIRPFYSMTESADFLNFLADDYKNLLKIKKVLAQKNNYKLIVEYNKILLLLSKYTNNKNKEKLLNIINAAPLGIKEHSVIKEIEKSIKLSKPMLFKYLSASSEYNFFKVLPECFKIENSKIYVYCYDKNIKETRCLLLSRIKSLMPIEEEYKTENINKFAIFKYNGSISNIDIFENYEILEQKNSHLILKIYYKNSFSFLQKILSLGTDCEILEPQETREIIYQKIKSIGELYEK